MITADQIKDNVFNILATIAPEADFDALNPDDNMMEALDIDSFDFLNFVIALDEAVGVNIPESDYGQVMTLNQLVEYVGAKSNGG